MTGQARQVTESEHELKDRLIQEMILELETLIIQNKNDLDKGNGVKLLNIYIEGLRQKIEK